MKVKSKVFITFTLAAILVAINGAIFDFSLQKTTDMVQTILLLSILEEVFKISEQEIEVQIFEREKFKKEEDDNFGS